MLYDVRNRFFQRNKGRVVLESASTKNGFEVQEAPDAGGMAELMLGFADLLRV